MKKIITTVGTSLFANYQKPETKDSFNKYVPIDTYMDNLQELYLKDYDENDSNIEDIIKVVQKYWLNNENGKPNINASAEIKSIIEIVKEAKEKCQVHLIATDTVLSVLAAELIRDWFKENKENYPNIEEVEFTRPETDFKEQSKSKYVIKDLRVNSKEDYEQGFMNLIEVLDKLYEKDKTILNITGGYKAIIPIMTIYGQLKEIPLKYIYNESELGSDSKLIEVGNLPINFDWDYIFHWELLIRKPALDYMSPIYEALLELENISHQHLKNRNEFKNISIEDSHKNKILNSEIRKLLPTYKKMIKENVLYIQDGELKPTLIGQLIQRFARQKQLVGSRLMGGIIEGFVYKLFSLPTSKRGIDQLNDYILCLNPSFSPTKYIAKENKKIEIDVDNGKKAEDIDITLQKNDGTIVLGECKSIWAYINKADDDYLNQIKARVLKQRAIDKKNGINRNIEFLFIAVSFRTFIDLEFDDDESSYNEILNAASFFEKIKDDLQIKEEMGNSTFTIHTAYFKRKLLIDSHNRIDWKDLLINVNKKDFNEVQLL